MWKWISVALAAFAASASAAHADPVVRTRQGLVQGFVSGSVEQFRGIPYAAAPLGDQRWRAPQPAASWSGVRAATSFAAPCIQARVTAGLPLPSEDCTSRKATRCSSILCKTRRTTATRSSPPNPP